MLGKLFILSFLVSTSLSCYIWSPSWFNAKKWHSIINEKLLSSKAISEAAILKLDGTIFGKSDNLQMTEEEAKQFAKHFDDQDSFSIARLAGVKYKLDHQKFTIMGKNGNTGFVAHKWDVIVIGFYNENQHPGGAKLVVSHVGQNVMDM